SWPLRSDRTPSRRELSQADEARLCAMIASHHACLRSIDDTIFADFERADNVYCCACLDRNCAHIPSGATMRSAAGPHGLAVALRARRRPNAQERRGGMVNIPTELLRTLVFVVDQRSFT